MDWLKVLAALAQVFLAILELARESRAKGAGRAEAIAQSATHALDLIRKARDARRALAGALRRCAHG